MEGEEKWEREEGEEKGKGRRRRELETGRWGDRRRGKGIGER